MIHPKDPGGLDWADTSTLGDDVLASGLQSGHRLQPSSASRLRTRLAKQGRKLPILGDDDEAANRNYIKHLVLIYDKKAGEEYGLGLGYAEKFHYIGPNESWIDRYIEESTVPL